MSATTDSERTCDAHPPECRARVALQASAPGLGPRRDDGLRPQRQRRHLRHQRARPARPAPQAARCSAAERPTQAPTRSLRSWRASSTGTSTRAGTLRGCSPERARPHSVASVSLELRRSYAAAATPSTARATASCERAAGRELLQGLHAAELLLPAALRAGAGSLRARHRGDRRGGQPHDAGPRAPRGSCSMSE